MLMPDWVVAQQKEIGTRFSKMKIWYDRFCRPLSCRCSSTSRDIKLVCNLGGKVLLKYDVNMWVMPNWPYHVTYRDDCERYLERWLKGCGWTMPRGLRSAYLWTAVVWHRREGKPALFSAAVWQMWCKKKMKCNSRKKQIRWLRDTVSGDFMLLLDSIEEE